MVSKKDILWSKQDPLHFWQSLAFTLRSEELTCVAVSSFVDKLGQNKLYIASNDPMNDSQQKQVTEIINMFLNMQPLHEIAAKLIPRHFSYLLKQFKKLNIAQVEAFSQEFPSKLSQEVETMFFTKGISLNNMRTLMNLIVVNRKVLREMKDGTTEGTSPATRKMTYHLCKMARIGEEIYFVLKKIQRHQQDSSLKSLSVPFQFIALHCHAELAILKTAKDCCASNTLYIGVSKRPCYCCSLFFKAVVENHCTDFNISIVTTHGKLYGKWSKIENCFEKEFNQVWAKVIEDSANASENKQMQQQTDENSSESALRYDEDYGAKMRY